MKTLFSPFPAAPAFWRGIFRRQARLFLAILFFAGLSPSGAWLAVPAAAQTVIPASSQGETQFAALHFAFKRYVWLFIAIAGLIAAVLSSFGKHGWLINVVIGAVAAGFLVYIIALAHDTGNV
ncbi:MAG: hypothetical protein PHV34_08455 [Verrucomicrobiae bacterium]|nr:hypothetical protein [Verrucomicrobiae bacterium]